MNSNENKLDFIDTDFKSIIEKINLSTNSITARDSYLKECNDSYTNFILEKLELNLGPGSYANELHHIFPKAIGGPELSWNEVYLSFEDHTEAHIIRAELYKQKPDIKAAKMRYSQTAEDKKIALQKSIATRKLLEITVFNREFQSRAGKIGGSTFSENKSSKWADKMNVSSKNAFANTMRWEHKSGKNLIVPANKFQRPQHLARALHEITPFKSDRIAEKDAPGGLSKVIKGERQSYNGWFLVKVD